MKNQSILIDAHLVVLIREKCHHTMRGQNDTKDGLLTEKDGQVLMSKT